jgi:hypothetical protein
MTGHIDVGYRIVMSALSEVPSWIFQMKCAFAEQFRVQALAGHVRVAPPEQPL